MCAYRSCEWYKYGGKSHKSQMKLVFGTRLSITIHPLAMESIGVLWAYCGARRLHSADSLTSGSANKKTSVASTKLTFRLVTPLSLRIQR